MALFQFLLIFVSHLHIPKPIIPNTQPRNGGINPIQGNISNFSLNSLINSFLFQILFVAFISLIIGFVIYFFFYLKPIHPKLFQQSKTKHSVNEIEFKIQFLLSYIDKFKNLQEYNKAGLIAWKIFTLVNSEFLDCHRKSTQTAREFIPFICATIHYEINEKFFEPFIILFEKAKYGNSKISIQEFSTGLTTLKKFIIISKNIGLRTNFVSEIPTKKSKLEKKAENLSKNKFKYSGSQSDPNYLLTRNQIKF